MKLERLRSSCMMRGVDRNSLRSGGRSAAPDQGDPSPSFISRTHMPETLRGVAPTSPRVSTREGPTPSALSAQRWKLRMPYDRPNIAETWKLGAGESWLWGTWVRTVVLVGTDLGELRRRIKVPRRINATTDPGADVKI